jgi:hypothetical protein
MTEDCNKYLLNKEFIQKWYREHGNNDPRKVVSVMATATMVPCIVVAYWIGEITGWPQEIHDAIDSLTKFYGYTEVKNKPENYPGP